MDLLTSLVESFLPGQPRHHHHDHVDACRDLVLAGEFGRELLQTNDELRAALERHRLESARRIEVFFSPFALSFKIAVIV